MCPCGAGGRCAISQAAVPSIQVVFVVRVHYARPGALKFDVLGCIRFGHFGPAAVEIRSHRVENKRNIYSCFFPIQIGKFSSFPFFNLLGSWCCAISVLQMVPGGSFLSDRRSNGQADTRTIGLPVGRTIDRTDDWTDQRSEKNMFLCRKHVSVLE